MNEPYLAIYIQNGALFFSKKIPSEREPRDIFELDIEEVISDNFDEASKKLGNTVLGILRLWHPDALLSWGGSSDLGEGVAQIQNDFDVAMYLISKSVSEKTKVHVNSINALLNESSQRFKAANDFLNESWPVIRARLEKFT